MGYFLCAIFRHHFSRVANLIVSININNVNFLVAISLPFEFV